MSKRDGFTLVEVMVAIVIMAILLTISIYSLNNLQADSRDSERQADTENIARALDTYYKDNGTGYPASGPVNTADKSTELLPDVSSDMFSTPGNTPAASWRVATNSSTSPTAVTPAVTTNLYVYQPLTATGALCTTGTVECRSYRLFYRLETSNQIVTVESKYQ